MAKVWRFAAASVMGTSHVSSGTPCQDAHSYHKCADHEGNPVMILVVSDGAGSASRAEAGSCLVCEVAVEAIAAHFTAGSALQELDRAWGLRWIGKLNDRVNEVAAQESVPSREYAATFLAAVIGVDSAVFFQIGDGAMVTREPSDKSWKPVFWPLHGEYANTTTFVVSPDAEEALQFVLRTGIVDEAALFSDGIENLVLQKATQEAHSPFFEGMIAPVRASAHEGLDTELSNQLSAYLDGPVVCTRTDDDKTLVLASRTEK